MKVHNSPFDVAFVRWFLWYYAIRYFFHLIYFKRFKELVEEDLMSELETYGGPSYYKDRSIVGNLLPLCWALSCDPYFLTLFYARINGYAQKLNLLKRDNSSFHIGCYQMGKQLKCYHPYNTILNCKSFGDNLTIRHNTTVGNKNDNNDLLPTLGHHVSIGAGVIIFGDITIGNNVIIGAGSVVNKDIPDNSVVVGNPFRIIRQLPPLQSANLS